MESKADTNSTQSQLNQRESPKGDIVGEADITLDVPVHTAYAFWSHFENLPRFMKHVDEVTETSPRHYTWRVDGPLGTTVSWNAVTTRMVNDELISWESVEDSEIVNSGSVHFMPTDDGRTHLRVRLAYTPPAGKLGHAVATMFGKNPEQQITDDLKSLQEILAKDGQTKSPTPAVNVL